MCNYYFSIEEKEKLRKQLPLSSVNRLFKIFLLVALSVFSTLNLRANDTFFSIEKSSDRIEEVANAGSDLLTKLDNLNLSNLTTKLDDIGSVSKSKFLDEFAGASEDALIALNNRTDLLDYWKANGSIIKNKS